MSATLPAIEAWIRIVGLALGALVVIAVPVTGFMKEYWAYRARLRESEGLRADAARAVSGPMLGHVLEIADLTGATLELGHAVRDLAAVVRAAQLRPSGRDEPVE